MILGVRRYDNKNLSNKSISFASFPVSSLFRWNQSIGSKNALPQSLSFQGTDRSNASSGKEIVIANLVSRTQFSLHRETRDSFWSNFGSWNLHSVQKPTNQTTTTAATRASCFPVLTQKDVGSLYETDWLSVERLCTMTVSWFIFPRGSFIAMQPFNNTARLSIDNGAW